MHFLDRYFDRIESSLVMHQTRVVHIFFLLLFSLFAIHLFSLAIVHTDTDLWYHLAGGRYLFSEQATYNPFVNSYLTEPREFINYFWAFQASVFLTWSLAGETGLIFLKGLLFLASGTLIAKIILKGQPLASSNFLHLLIIAICITILAYRGLSFRPHVFSYVFIPLFIFILGHREKYYPLLPLLTVAWANFHGVEYVVGALVCGAFFLPRLLAYFLDGQKQTGSVRAMIWIFLCLPAMMINPNGIYLLATPFIQSPGLEYFILELGTFEIKPVIDLTSGISINVAFLILMAIVIRGTLHAVDEPITNLPPLLLALGGLILLSMGNRFFWEWMLLSTPMLAVAATTWQIKLGPRSAGLLVIYFGLLVFTFLPATVRGWQHYPFDPYSLPYGTTQFLEKSGFKGRYATPPSFAGYTEFASSKDVSIHMDMQFPPFSSMELYEISSATWNGQALSRYIEKYQPGAIGAKKSSDAFPTLIAKELGYVPVFFDTLIALYINKAAHPEIAKAFELKTLNPFSEGEVQRDQLDQAINELRRMVDFISTPDTRLTLVGLLIENHDLAAASQYLEQLKVETPGNPSVPYFEARINHLKDDCARAIPLYERSFYGTPDPQPTHRFVAECYFLVGDQFNAYTHYDAAINPFKDGNPNSLTYYQFALVAIAVGETDRAIQLLTMITITDRDFEYSTQINALLAELRADQ